MGYKEGAVKIALIFLAIQGIFDAIALLIIFPSCPILGAHFMKR